MGSGASVVVNSEDGSFFIGGAYTILDSSGALTGAFSPIVITNTTITPIIVYQGNDVLLDFRPGFLACAIDQTGGNVAEQLFTITTPDAEQALILSEITSLDCADIGAALDALSGSQYAGLLLEVELSTRQFVRRLYDPLRLFLAKDMTCCVWDPCGCNRGLEGWFEAGAIQANFRGKEHNNHHDRHHNSGSGCCGRRHHLKSYGYQISGGFQAECGNSIGGVALTYEHTNGTFRNCGNAHCHTNTWLGGLYGAVRECDFYLMGDLVLGGSQTKLKRNVYFGDLGFHERGKPEAFQGILYGEIGYDFRYCSFLVQPFLGLEGGYYSWKSTHEHGDDFARLKLKERNYGTFDTRLGAHFVLDETECYGLFVGVDLAWQYRCSPTNTFVDVEFEDFGSGFHSHGINLDQSSFDAALNIEQQVGNNWSVFASGYWQQWSSTLYAYDILAEFTYSW